ncbi:hypothetical protein M011DRAFT_466061 [Sporormia fimetaria CBS 119925]|uniref:Uncharacterized protein n=1 Tax=Sporormia fimetaria CBS 119925 TaxID=1340428 RepID=A0A6A6VED9_9PLEO|nr:hypothetical protein M011DRAFT_466061 [Sporormia fimetaria CBS 119925]
MKLTFALFTIWMAVVYGQQPLECTKEVVRSDDCAEVINANACYNKYRFRNKQVLTCIDGANDTERAEKACKCCACVGQVMCDWAKSQNVCK